MTTRQFIELTGLPDYMDSMEDAAYAIISEGFATGARVVTLTQEQVGPDAFASPDGGGRIPARQRWVSEWEGVQE